MSTLLTSDIEGSFAVMANREAKAVTVVVEVAKATRPPAQPANWFQLIRIADAFELMVGFVDLADLQQATTGVDASQTSPSVPVDLLSRLVLTRTAAEQLRAHLDKVLASKDE